MKKQIIAIAIMFGLGLTASAAPNEGLFNRAGNAENGNSGYAYFNGEARNGGVSTPALPLHNQTGNQNAPLGSGIAVLTALGAAYLVGKRRNED